MDRAEDAPGPPVRRVVLMGGGAEEDRASTAFAEAAGGGDVVILRASGSLTSYPDYFTRTLTPAPNPASVATVRTTSPSAASDAAVLCRVARAEAIWLAGGDQWNYLGLWPDTLHRLIEGTSTGNVAIGGTSAGAMSLGGAAFDARNGTVTSTEALANPLRGEVAISYSVMTQPELASAIVDTHFMNRDREGRLLAFMARFRSEGGLTEVIGIGLDEGTALVIEAGTFRARTRGAGAVWVYRLALPVSLTRGEALDLDEVERVQLQDGAEGDWPIDFARHTTASLMVVDGVVQPHSALRARR